jgi:ubiquinone/menaquinone biosynthesis C-methylase UbiE
MIFKLKDFPGFSRKDLTALEDYYRAQLEGHAAPERRVGWNNAHGQQARFEALALSGNLKGMKVLDVGCGLGAFWGYLKKKKLGVDYTGVDLFPNVIAEAKRHFPDALFEARVLTAKPFPARSFDYSFLSGVFNVKVKDNWLYMRALLRCVMKQTRLCVAFNVLNAEAGLKEKDRFMVHSKDLVAFGKRMGASKVRLLDHYHPMDLTLFLYR